MGRLQDVPRGLEGHCSQLGTVAAEPGSPHRAAVLLQPCHFGRGALVVADTVGQLRVLLPQARVAEVVHGSQRRRSPSPAEGSQAVITPVFRVAVDGLSPAHTPTCK